MAVRNFNGSNEEIRVATGDADLTGDFTVAALIKRGSTGSWQSMIAGHTSAGNYQWEFAFNPSNVPVFYTVVSAQMVEATGMSVSSTTTWVILVYTKSGNTTRFHLYELGGSWTHVAGSLGGTIDPPTSIAGGTIRFGEAQDTDDLNARLATAGVWTTGLSDAQVESLSSGLETSSWTGHSIAPDAVWDFNQESVTDSVLDLVGSSNQTLRNGTTVVTSDDPPGWTFGAGSGTPLLNLSGSSAASGSLSLSVPTVEPDIFVRVSGSWAPVDRKIRVGGSWV